MKTRIWILALKLALSQGAQAQETIRGSFLKALALAGKAVFGGDSNEITYEQSNFNFDGFGGNAPVYYRTECFIELGVSLPLIFRNVQWDTINPNLKVCSRSNPLITMMAT